MAKDMKAALSKSLENERTAVEDRFAQAESLLGGKPKTTEKKVVKPRKPKVVVSRVKVVRDSFTLPEPDYELISQIKKDCMKAGVEANKSEIVRAGLKVLSGMNQAQLKKAINEIERVKTGRPKQD